MTNLEKIRSCSKEELIPILLSQRDGSSLGVCDTDLCPYRSTCDHVLSCRLTDEEEISIWLDKESD